MNWKTVWMFSTFGAKSRMFVACFAIAAAIARPSSADFPRPLAALMKTCLLFGKSVVGSGSSGFFFYWFSSLIRLL